MADSAATTLDTKYATGATRRRVVSGLGTMHLETMRGANGIAARRPVSSCSWSAIAAKQTTVPAFHDRWPLRPG